MAYNKNKTSSTYEGAKKSWQELADEKLKLTGDKLVQIMIDFRENLQNTRRVGSYQISFPTMPSQEENIRVLLTSWVYCLLNMSILAL